jgi:hypothetical protein
MSNEARILPPVPAIASKGQVVDDRTMYLMELAAERLNAKHVTSYEVLFDQTGMYDDDGKKLDEGQHRVYIRGLWVDSLCQDEHLLKFLGLVAELETELSDRVWSPDPLLSPLVFVRDYHDI